MPPSKEQRSEHAQLLEEVRLLKAEATVDSLTEAAGIKDQADALCAVMNEKTAEFTAITSILKEVLAHYDGCMHRDELHAAVGWLKVLSHLKFRVSAWTEQEAETLAQERQEANEKKKATIAARKTNQAGLIKLCVCVCLCVINLYVALNLNF